MDKKENNTYEKKLQKIIKKYRRRVFINKLKKLLRKIK
tara:strand:- start:339 stop:452 length:114 start_codon:yes stop_codon:yes gene_type:complete